MQPLIVAEQIRQGLADFLATTFPATTAGFEALMGDFLATPGKLAQGPYVTIGLPLTCRSLRMDRAEVLQP